MKQFIRFALVGAAATALHYGIYYLLITVHDGGQLYLSAAYAAGYIISMIFNYLMTAFFTFESRPSLRNFVGFCSAHAVNFCLHLVLLNLFLYLGIPERWAPIPVFAIAIPVNFILVRYAFKNKKECAA